MRLAIYGGSFNPPHLGHVKAAISAKEALKLDKLYIMPVSDPPHKAIYPGSPSAEVRYQMCQKTFTGLSGIEVSNLELLRGNKSYTAETVENIRANYPDAELYLLMGTDMLFAFEKWYRFHDIFQMCKLGVFTRNKGEEQDVYNYVAFLREHYAAKIDFVPNDPIPVSSTAVRELLSVRGGTEYLAPEVYEDIIRNRYYQAQPNLAWLRDQAYPYLDKKRIPHVEGTEKEAKALAERWDVDIGSAAEAAILHDITKNRNLEQHLQLCSKYGLKNDDGEKTNPKLLHSKTGAALSRELFGISDAIYSAIRWHTTARPGMTVFEKILYLADYIEPTRDFEGVAKLRKLAYTDLDAAMVLGLQMSLEDIRSYGVEPHEMTSKALSWFLALGK